MAPVFLKIFECVRSIINVAVKINDFIRKSILCGTMQFAL